MNRFIALALILLLAFPIGVHAEADGGSAELVIGTLTHMSGDFFTDMWGNNTTDIDVRALIHGYSTVAYTGDGNYALDQTVLSDSKVTDDERGRTYEFTLNGSLKYNDGTAITARDYVFSALLLSDPRMTDSGAVPGALEQLVGFDEYVAGVRGEQLGAVFSGVRLIADDKFSITIKKDRLPYFYELALAAIQPYPMHVIAPECDVADDGDGAYITGPFSAELLGETVLDPDTGYRFHPEVTCGPYTLVSHDREEGAAVFQVNPEYLGNFEGKRPEIEQLTLVPASQEDMLEKLQSGELDLLHKVSSGARISEGMGLVSSGEIESTSYLRAGLSFFSFACEQGPTQSQAVRQAIAMCTDPQTLVDEFLQGYGLVTYAYYGYGQWMASGNDEALLSLARYALNVNAAVGLLEDDGWVLDELGNEYDDDLGGVRHRLAADGSLEKLSIRWAYPDNTDAVQVLLPMMQANMAQAGFELIPTELPFAELLRNYYRQDERAYDMFFMATNFALVFDPYYTFNTGDQYQGVFNTTGIRDEELMQLAEDMRRSEPDDSEGYLEKWQAFQERFVEVLPLAPLYANIYFDFYRTDLQNYLPNANWSFSSALMYAYLGEPREESDGLEEGEEEQAGEDFGEESDEDSDDMVILD